LSKTLLIFRKILRSSQLLYFDLLFFTYYFTQFFHFTHSTAKPPLSSIRTARERWNPCYIRPPIELTATGTCFHRDADWSVR